MKKNSEQECKSEKNSLLKENTMKIVCVFRIFLSYIFDSAGRIKSTENIERGGNVKAKKNAIEIRRSKNGGKTFVLEF